MGKEDVTVTEYLEKCRNVWVLADKTIKSRTEALDLYFNNYNGQLTLNSFEGFIGWLKNKNNTIQTITSRGSIIRLFLKYCVKKGMCQDFVDDIRLPRVYHEKVKVVPIEDAERAILLATEIGKTDNQKIRRNKIESRVALKFDLRTGLRLSELLNLKSEDFLLEEGIFWVDTTKSHRREPMPIPIDMIDDIKSRMGREYIFEGINSFTLNNALHRGSKKAGLSLRLHLHTLRAIFCTTQLKNKQSMQVVRDLMRHANFDSLGKYSFAQMDEKKSALNTSPIIVNGLQPEQIIQLVKDAINSTGISKDERLHTNMTERKTKEGKMVFNLNIVY